MAPQNHLHDSLKNGQLDHVKRQDNAIGKEKEWNCFEHIIWFNVAWFVGLHLGGLYGAYLVFTQAKIVTTLFGNTKKFYLHF